MVDQFTDESWERSQLRGGPRKRRRFSPEDKVRLLEAAGACNGRGQLSALLRREGITHSHLTAWRRRLQPTGDDGLAQVRPCQGPHADVRDRLIEKQQREILELERKLSIVTQLVEMQKKAQEIFGMARSKIEDCSRPD